jgi:hypothetical protein
MIFTDTENISDFSDKIQSLELLYDGLREVAENRERELTVLKEFAEADADNKTHPESESFLGKVKEALGKK